MCRKLLVLCLAWASFSGALADTGNRSLSDLKALDATSPQASFGAGMELERDSPMKLAAMRDAALAVGAQHGYAYRIDALKSEIRYQADALDRLYDFSSLMRLSGSPADQMYLLPPVIDHATNLVAVDDAHRRIRTSDEMYVISEPARLVTRPPDWREYLIFDNSPRLTMPDKVLLPETTAEKRYWSAWVEEGWEAGVIQAEMEMASRVRRLASTYTGMVRYARMNVEQRVESPHISSHLSGISGTEDQVRLNDRMYELVEGARLVTDPSKWRALGGDSRDSLLMPDEATLIDQPALERRELINEVPDPHHLAADPLPQHDPEPPTEDTRGHLSIFGGGR